MPTEDPQPLHLSPRLEELERIVQWIDAFADAHALHPGDTNVVNVAIEELFANTIKHSHPPATEVEFSLRLDGEDVVANYADDGSAFDPTGHATPDTGLGAEHRPIGGLGIHFIRETTQAFEYRREDDRNYITFRRRLRR